MALKLGELAAVLTTDDTQFESGLDRSESRFQDFGTRLEGAATAVGASAALALGVALAGALEFDAAQAKLSAQLGSSEYAEDLGRVAGNLYARGFGASASEAMESVRQVMMSGLLPEDADNGVIEDITRKAQALAHTFGVDVVEASRAAGQLIRTGLARDAAEAFDIITRAFQQTGDQAGDLLDTFSEYSTQFRKLGLDGIAATGLLTQGLRAGARDIDVVADAMKEFSIRAVDGSATTAAGFQAIGLNAQTMTAQIAKGGDSAAAGLDTVLDRLRSMSDPVAQSQAAVALFGTQAEDLGAALYALDPTSAVAAMGQVDGAAGKMADTLEQSASQQLEAFKRQAQQALVAELAKALPALQAVAGFLRDNHEVVVPLAEALGILAIAIVGIVAVTKAWTIAQTALSAVMTLTPIGLIVIGIAAIVAGILLLWNNSSAFREFWIGAWELITAGPVALWHWTRDNWPLLLAILTGPIGLAVRYIAKHWDAIRAGATAAKDWVVDKWSDLLDWFEGLQGRIRSRARGMWDGVKDAFRSMINYLLVRWNGLSFTIGGGSIAGISIPSLTLGTPDLPYLATGGEVTAAGLAMVGERGREAVYLPAGASVRSNRYDTADDGRGGLLELLLHGEFRISGSDLVLVLRDRVAVDGGDVQAVIGSNT